MAYATGRRDLYKVVSMAQKKIYARKHAGALPVTVTWAVPSPLCLRFPGDKMKCLRLRAPPPVLACWAALIRLTHSSELSVTHSTYLPRASCLDQCLLGGTEAGLQDEYNSLFPSQEVLTLLPRQFISTSKYVSSVETCSLGEQFPQVTPSYQRAPQFHVPLSPQHEDHGLS